MIALAIFAEKLSGFGIVKFKDGLKWCLCSVEGQHNAVLLLNGELVNEMGL